MGKVDWTPGLTIEEAEKQCVLQALRFYRHNKTQTAQSLGISIRTLDSKLEAYEKDREKSQAHYEQPDAAEINERFRGISIEARNRVLDAERAFERQSGKSYKAVDDTKFDAPAVGASFGSEASFDAARIEFLEREQAKRDAASVSGNDTAKPSEETTENGNDPGPGLHVEPAHDASAQQPVPVPVGPQVQAVLPRQASSHSKRHGR